MGWRASIGALYPADGDQDADLWRYLPTGVSLHITRLTGIADNVTVEKVAALAESVELEGAARMLATIPLNVVALVCTAESFIHGPGGDQELVRRLESATGLPATTTSTALVAAARALSVNRLSVIAPYPSEITERLVGFLSGNNLEVPRCCSLELPAPSQYGAASQESLYRLARSADCAESQALFISCTGLATADLIHVLEEDLGKPVISANQVTMWHALTVAGVHSRLPGLGALYDLTVLV
jgi:maleate isomerase